LLEDIAKRRVPGEGPVQIEPLAAGLVNRSYRVTRAGRQYSLRLGTSDAGLGLDRHWECRIRAAAAAAGLAPTVRHCDPAAGILVADWAAGRCWTPEDVSLADNLDAMAQLLRRVHSLVIPEPARHMTPASWIAHYDMPGREELRANAAVRLAALGPAAARTVCHSDLHRLNVVIGDRLRLLDWEYAHVSEPLWDLAGWIANNDLPDAVAQQFLARYLEGRVGADDSSRLGQLLWLYDYVCLLWSDRYSQQRPGLPSGAVRERAEVLARRLTGASGSRAGQVPAH
jgi:thiamine kinase-like enzyme